MKRYGVLAGIALVFIISAIAMIRAQEGGPSFSVMVTMDTNGHSIYVPDGGGQILGTGSFQEHNYEMPDHYYLASYNDSGLVGLAAADGRHMNVTVDETSHSIRVVQSIADKPRVFLTFTSGDWSRIDSVISLIEERSFLTQIAPSFAFGFGDVHMISILLTYTTIALDGDLEFQRGIHRLSFENTGLNAEGKPEIFIDVA